MSCIQPAYYKSLICLRRRPPPTIQGRSAPKIPLSAGSITISIVETKAPAQTGPGPARSAKDRALARLQKKSKLGTQQASDEVEGFKFSVTWEPTNGALGINISPEEYYLPEEMLRVVCRISVFLIFFCSRTREESGQS